VLGPCIDERHVLARLHHMGAGIPANGTSSDDSYLPIHAFPLVFLRPRTQPARSSLATTLADLGLSPTVRFAPKATCPESQSLTPSRHKPHLDDVNRGNIHRVGCRRRD